MGKIIKVKNTNNAAGFCIVGGKGEIFMIPDTNKFHQHAMLVYLLICCLQKI